MEKVLGTISAALVLATTLTGFLAARTSGERDDLEVQRDELETQVRDLSQERDRLEAAVEEANRQIETLEAAAETTTTTTAPDSGSDSPVDPALTYLNELEPVASNGRVDTERTSFGGTDYRNVVNLDLRVRCQRAEAEYNLGKAYSRFTASVGLHDNIEHTDERWLFVVETIDDNGTQIVFEEEIPFGQVEDLDLPVDGVIRLRLAVEEIEAGSGGGNCTREYSGATWADPALHP